jgi:hypothetical protein
MQNYESSAGVLGNGGGPWSAWRVKWRRGVLNKNWRLLSIRAGWMSPITASR